jgi:hypothetical protein
MSIKCPNNATGPATLPVSGNLTPVPAGAAVHVHYAGPNNQAVDHDVKTGANGAWNDRASFSVNGNWTVTASFAGDNTYEPSSANCSVKIGP